MSTPTLMRTLRTAQFLATLLGDHGFPMTEMTATNYGTIRVHFDPYWRVSIIAATLDLPVTETKHHAGDNKYTVVKAEFHHCKVDLFGAYEGASEQVTA